VIQKQFGRLKIAMLHGDQFCLDDPHYARFYRQVREPKWQHHFLSQSLQKRVQEVEQIRQHTPALYSPEAYAKLYLVPEIFSRLSEIRDADLLVHGHFHLPQQEQVMLSEHPLMRYGLDEWKEKGNYLLIENDSPQWIEFS
jgi:UDP-2,3-diacylglucosamine hydrolase